jgi:hypothetical protein
MAVNDRHPKYNQRHPQWVRLHDAIDGEDAVKSRGTVYLPKLSGQNDEEYKAYLMRAMFYGATDRTVDGLVGAILRKPAELEWPDAKEDDLKTVGRAGESWPEIVHSTLEEVIGVGRYGLHVDAPGEGEGAPYVAAYCAEAITNWETAVIDGRVETISVTLEEQAFVYDKKGTREEQTKYRVLRLGPARTIPMPGFVEDEENQPTKFDQYLRDTLGLEDSDLDGEGQIYWVEVWRKGDKEEARKGHEWVIETVVVPRVAGGATLNRIPFVFFNPVSTKAAPEKPPLLDMVNVNMSHYRNSADLEHGRHFTALPTPWAAGFDFKDGALTIGSETAWVSEEPGANAGYLEFTGAGLGHLREGMQDKEKLMAVQGARLLEEEPAGVETAEAVQLRHQGEDSALARISKAVSAGLTKVLQHLGRWLAVADYEALLTKLNKDFDLTQIDPALLQQLMQAVQSGVMSWNTFFFQCQKHEMYPDDVSEEDEYKRIMEGPPMNLLEQAREDELNEHGEVREDEKQEHAEEREDQHRAEDKEERKAAAKNQPPAKG